MIFGYRNKLCNMYFKLLNSYSVMETFESDSTRTGKFLSKALIFATTNPQYDDRLFIELQVQYWKIPSSNLIHENSKLKPWENMLCAEIVFDI